MAKNSPVNGISLKKWPSRGNTLADRVASSNRNKALAKDYVAPSIRKFSWEESK